MSKEVLAGTENEGFLLAQLEDKIWDTVTNYTSKVPTPHGAVMSGGFDSGLLCAITRPSDLFRMKFPYGTRFDESRYADAVLNHLGMKDRMTEIEITPKNFQENFEPAVKVMGEVTPHFSLVPLYIMFKTIKNAGVKDILSGEGPDEYLGGYARQIIFDELSKLYKIPELRNYHGIVHKAIEIGDDNKELAIAYAEVVGYDPEKYIPFIDNNSDKYPLQGLIGKMDMTLGHIEEMEQKMANHFGINCHYPYIDNGLAEFCYKLPDDLKIRNGVTKWGFRQIAMKYLPEIMRDRAKMGGPVAPVNRLMGWDILDFDKERYTKEQERILNG